MSLEAVQTAEEPCLPAILQWYDPKTVIPLHFVSSGEEKTVLQGLKERTYSLITSMKPLSLKEHIEALAGPEQYETAKAVYLCVLSEPADSKDTMKHMLDTLYVILYEVCTSTNYLVVGDGKKFLFSLN